MNTLARSLLLAAMAAVALAPRLSAGILLNETFAYTDGGLIVNSGSNWAFLSGTTTQLQVVGGVVTGMVHGSGSREDAARIFSATPITSGSVYARFDLTVTTAPIAGQDYFFAMNGLADTNFRGRVFLAAPAVAVANNFRLGISNGTSTVAYTSDLPAGSYKVLVRTTTGTTGSAVWVGTDALNFIEGTTSATATDTTTAQGLARASLRQGTSITVANGINVDNLVVATTFNEAVPEPASFASIAGAVALAGSALRRRRS